ncbi:MAG: DinB family protein [Planctomycetia bacterium]
MGTDLNLAISQIQFARDYTQSLLAGIPDDCWFVQPQNVVTHIAWQVGHLAMAQYGLCLFRIRGRADTDLDLMSSAFRKKFSRGTTPDADPSRNPTVSEIRSVLDRVHEQSLLELAGFSESLLAEGVDPPFAVYPNKLGCLLFCSHHEMIHAGQIGLLRRLLGLAPVR